MEHKIQLIKTNSYETANLKGLQDSKKLQAFLF